ncbi:MAG: FHA domain-containing protein [Comamonadaceae bacterium]|nr:MAG: FHA domain-containing protein [Comamonadaceae bacterium]
MPKLTVSFDGNVIKEVILAKDRTTLGRRPYNDIVIDNLAISGEHAVLHMVGSDVYLEDLNSTNGTYVNARAIKKQVLRDNDLIEVGKYKIRYLAKATLSDGVADPASQARSSAPAEAMSLTGAATVPAPLGMAGTGTAVIKVLSGPGAGREVSLQKVVTTIGKPGIAVAAVTRRLQGFVLTRVDGNALHNGLPVGPDTVQLQDGDMLEIASTTMQFVLA